ncbi:MAG: hypothetical protein AAGE03_15620 [Pseudomonadota bacterium]
MRALAPYLAALGLSILLLVAGTVWDGWWDFASLIWMAVVVALLDHILPEHGPGPDATFAKALSTGLAVVHFPLLGMAIWTLAEGGPVANWIAYFCASGLFFGQIMNSCAHELIHARDRLRYNLGKWTYVTLLFGHQTTAHPGIHHVKVATPEDPNTARYNESWWMFCFRAWHYSFWRGYALEKRRLRAKGLHPLHWRNPYHIYVGGGLLCLGGAYVIHGGLGMSIISLMVMMNHYSVLIVVWKFCEELLD